MPLPLDQAITLETRTVREIVGYVAEEFCYPFSYIHEKMSLRKCEYWLDCFHNEVDYGDGLEYAIKDFGSNIDTAVQDKDYSRLKKLLSYSGTSQDSLDWPLRNLFILSGVDTPAASALTVSPENRKMALFLIQHGADINALEPEVLAKAGLTKSDYRGIAKQRLSAESIVRAMT